MFIGYNSIGGFSTVNHMHFQLFDVREFNKEKCLFYIEGVEIETVQEAKTIISTFGCHKKTKDLLFNAFTF